MSNDIRKKLWQIDLVVKDIKKFPQTYKTILGSLCNDGTCQLILRRKLNILFKEGSIFKTSIPGTRFGQAIFYNIPKEYTIIIEADRASSKVYCFFKSVQKSKYYLKIAPCWLLTTDGWKPLDEKIIFEGNVLKII